MLACQVAKIPEQCTLCIRVVSNLCVPWSVNSIASIHAWIVLNLQKNLEKKWTVSLTDQIPGTQASHVVGWETGSCQSFCIWSDQSAKRRGQGSVGETNDSGGRERVLVCTCHQLLWSTTKGGCPCMCTCTHVGTHAHTHAHTHTHTHSSLMMLSNGQTRVALKRFLTVLSLQKRGSLLTKTYMRLTNPATRLSEKRVIKS